MYNILKQSANLLVLVILGILAFLLVVGIYPLNPINVSWLDGGYDPTQHYMGWVFFRTSPWTLPIGLSPDFGMEYSSSIVYSDSIPLFAFIFKFFSPWLSQPFQYFGIWYLLCFIFQSIFAYLCVGIFVPKEHNLIKFLCVGLLLFSPPMLWRIGLHASLAAHFVILASLYLIFKPYKRRNSIYWIVLLDVTILIHLYLFAILVAIWIGGLLDDWRTKKIQALNLCLEICTVIASTVILLWQIGFFEVSVQSSTTGDYGVYGFGLFSFFDSQNWSYLIKALPGGTLESFNYFGLGIFFLASVMLFSKSAKYKNISEAVKAHPYFCGALMLLFIFAISNSVRIGSLVISIPLPQEIFSLASIFRASARMAWPLYYVVVLGILYGVIKFFSSKKATWLIVLALFIQVADTSAGWYLIHKQFSQASSRTGFESPLKSPFWKRAAEEYSQLINTSFPSGPPNLYVGWNIWANYAAQYNMKTNSAWLSRYDSIRLSDAKKSLAKEISTGTFSKDSLYIVQEDLLIPISMHMDASKDLLSRVDNFIVLAPGWKKCTSCMSVWSNELKLTPIPIPKINHEFSFGKGGIGSIFLVGINQYQITGWGWAFPESWGVWAEGGRAKLTVPLPSDRASTFILRMRSLVGPGRANQQVQILVNGVTQKTIILSEEGFVNIDIPKVDYQDYLLIEFILPDHISPKKLGVGDDDRQLSIGLISGIFQ